MAQNGMIVFLGPIFAASIIACREMVEWCTEWCSVSHEEGGGPLSMYKAVDV